MVSQRIKKKIIFIIKLYNVSGDHLGEKEFGIYVFHLSLTKLCIQKGKAITNSIITRRKYI